MSQVLDLSLRRVLRNAIHTALVNRAMRDRKQIAEELTIAVGRKISVAMLDAWTADSRQEWHIPADCIVALCAILQDDSLQRHLLSAGMRRSLELGEDLTRVRLLLDEIVTKARAAQPLKTSRHKKAQPNSKRS